MEMPSGGQEATMCLAIPGKVVEFHENHGVRMSKVDFGGITREACLEYLPEVKLGDYVLVHVGFAISKVDEEEAARTYRFLEEMDQLGEVRSADIDDTGSELRTESRTESDDEIP
jgi:hydrogenase expression/formation protein HypC